MLDEAEKHIALYVLCQFPDNTCDKHKLFKIMYFAYKQYLAECGKKMFSGKFVRYPYGPVPEELFTLLKTNSIQDFIINVDRQTLKAIVLPDEDYIAEAEKDYLDEAIAMCRNKSFNQLTNTSHDNAWKNAATKETINIYDIARSGGADKDMLDYIKFHNEAIYFGAGCTAV